MKYIVVALDYNDLMQNMTSNHGASNPYYLCHAVARIYQKHWGMVATVHGGEYIATGCGLNTVDLPSPVFSKESMVEGEASGTIPINPSNVDVSYYNGLVIIKFT